MIRHLSNTVAVALVLSQVIAICLLGAAACFLGLDRLDAWCRNRLED